MYVTFSEKSETISDLYIQVMNVRTNERWSQKKEINEDINCEVNSFDIDNR